MSIKLKERFQSIILDSTGASEISSLETIQNLWSGYGKIIRCYLKGAKEASVVVKNVRFPNQTNHPRGWNTDLSHQRKLHSYQVETNWYQEYSDRCDAQCRIPKCLAMENYDDEVLMVMEDLNASGFPGRKSAVTWKEMQSCIRWLANFHATFLGVATAGLWEIGTYWHLDTRPEELQALDDHALREAAVEIDLALRQSPFQTLVHGDAKLANFCFDQMGDKVAAVDFQYVGGGCGMKDLAYFVGSCLYEDQCEKMESRILSFYFNELKLALDRKGQHLDFAELEQNWRVLFPVAWTDFHRFLKGWSPDHWKINSYSERTSRQVIDQLKKVKSI